MRRHVAPILWVFVLGIIPAVLYGWYFLGQKQRIAELNQRELGRAAENLRSVLNGSAINVRNLRAKPSFTCDFLQRQIYLAMPPGKTCTDYEDPRNVPVQDQAQSTVKVTNEAITICAGDHDFCFRVALGKVLDELLVGNGFEYLFVATSAGEVFFQTRRGERQRWMDNLRWANRHLRDETIATVLPVRLRNIDGLGERSEGKAPGLVSKDNTNSLPVEIAGERYRMYLQPVPQVESQSAPVIVGGLVSMRADLMAALAVEPRFALALTFLVGLGLLTWPLLKIVVLAPGERFSFTDSKLLLLSGAALLGVSTVVLLDADNARRIGAFGTERLVSLADKLAGDLVQELSDAGRQLSEYDSAVAAAFKKGECTATGRDVLWEQTRLLRPDSENAGTQMPSVPEGFGGLHLPAPSLYRSPIAVFWARASGWQFAKTTAGIKNTPPVTVRERPYFRAARDRHLWKVAPRPGPWFYTQIYRSITTGDFETGIAIPSSAECSGAGNTVAVLTTPTLNSLSPKALPPDYGFMMIDRSGRVLYHSDPRRALREDLFEEVSNADRLRAIVMAEQAVPFTANYGSGSHEFYIRPLKEIKDGEGDFNGWYIVTFRDLQLARTGNIEAAISTLVWFGLYFVLVQFVPTLVLLLRGRRRSRWMWPDRDKLALYRRVAVQMAILTSAALIAILVSDGWWLMACSYLTGAFAMALGCWEYRRWKSGYRQDSWLSGLLGGLGFRASRTACVALLFVPISILPAAGIFKFAWNDEARRLLTYEEKHVAETARDLRWEIEDRANQQFAAAYPPASNWSAMAKEYLAAQERVVVFPPGDAGATGSPDPLAGWKAVYNDASAALRYQVSRTDLMSGGRDFSMKPGPFTLVGGFVLLFCLLGSIRYWDNRLMLSGVQPQATNVKDEIEAAWRNGRSALVLVNSRQQEDAILALMTGAPAALAATASMAGGDAQSVAQPARTETFYLTEAFREADARKAALTRMEDIAEGGRGLVLSRLDPAQVVFTEYAAGPGGPDESERRRWSDTLQRFSLVLVPPEPPTQATGEPEDDIHRRLRTWPYFAALWDTCTDTEKLTLIQVAEEGFANPKQPQITERLLRRGLLVKRPALEPFDRAFGQFIREVYDRSQVADWERPSKGMGWSQSRWVLSLLLVTLGVFLMSTQRDVLNPIVSFVPTLGGAVTAILKVVGDLSPKRTAASG